MLSRLSTAATLTSNGCPIPFTAQYFGNLRESDAGTTDVATLRARYATDGYVFLRGAIPAEAIWTVRGAYLSMFGDEPSGPRGPAYGTKGHPAYEFVRGAIFREFTALEAFSELAEAIVDGPVSLIRRTPLRHFIPGRKTASRAHLDKTYIDGVAAEIMTMWVPLGDCPIEAGGLLYLEGSHQDPALEAKVRDDAPMDRANDNRPLTHDLKWLADTTSRRWLSANYRAGDIVIHSPAIVHASIDSMRDPVRVSTDIRFRRADSLSDPRWDSDWSADDGY